ncbi:MAG: hypothetical protein H0W06_08500 [Chloroflexia bacterium]|nr:hypothetical protein [Chloroflexia bacterium]
MDFGPFVIISAIYTIIGIRSIVRLLRRWRETWDDHFTLPDRALVDEAAFFVLIPISVALHEFGHAVAIWAFGGEVVDFGFYGFAGFVAYSEPFTNAQQTVVAAAGSGVNLLLCLLAIGIVLLWRPSPRAPINELLLQFALLSGINAFIVYPLLDLLSELNGDWRQVYFGGAPAISAAVIVVQIMTLSAGFWLVTDEGMRERLARLTGVPPGFRRGPLGGLRRAEQPPESLSPSESVLREAADRVRSGWPTPIHTALQRQDAGSTLVLSWQDDTGERAVLAHVRTHGPTELWGVGGIAPGAAPPGLQRRALRQWTALPSADELTLALRASMEVVASW